MPKERTCISHNLPFHPENLFSSRENAKKNPKEKEDQDKLLSLCLIKKESVLSTELSCELRDR